ncbi:MAG: thioredoxin family protein, partial [Pseudomonadota bacterium]
MPWYQGTVEAAFAAAKSQDKPIFLYWGAEWCPPCKELKSIIFRQDAFIQQSELFVPVYLDGDTERAQRYGERFGVVGYPTVIIFDPKGSEITRIPGGMNIEQYVGVLELALGTIRPMQELLQSARNGGDMRDDDWRLLASYSWGQDKSLADGPDALHTLLLELATDCPAEVEDAKSRLQLLAFQSWAASEERDDALADQYLAAAQTVLDSPGLREENLREFIEGGALYLNALDEASAAALRDPVSELLAAAVADSSLDVLTRLDAAYALVQVQNTALAEGESRSAEQQDWVTAQAAALRPLADSYQEDAALNRMTYLFREAGLVEEARVTLLEGVETSDEPYYFMSGLSFLAMERGDADSAINWS